MTPKQSAVRSGCPIANALDLLGDRWTLLIVRDLIFERRREFGEFLGAGEGIATNILADRLARLCCAGLVARFDHPTDGKKYVYRITESGLDLIPLLIEMVLWSAKHLSATKAPAARREPHKRRRAAVIAELRRSLRAELKAAGKPV